MEKTASEIVTVKKNIRLQEWNRQIEEQKAERSVVPILTTLSDRNITIEKNGLRITLPENISAEVLIAVVSKLC